MLSKCTYPVCKTLCHVMSSLTQKEKKIEVYMILIMISLRHHQVSQVWLELIYMSHIHAFFKHIIIFSSNLLNFLSNSLQLGIKAQSGLSINHHYLVRHSALSNSFWFHCTSSQKKITLVEDFFINSFAIVKKLNYLCYIFLLVASV